MSQRVGEVDVAKRADARRNIEAILEAATACLARDPDVSVGEIAKAAGVGRVTLYGHFGSRQELVAQVVETAMARAEEAVGALDLRGDPEEALTRLLEVTWEVTHRYGALVVAAEHTLTDAALRQAHEAPARRVERILRRGRRSGAFRTDMPIGWQVTAMQAVLHAASGAVHRGEITDEAAPQLVRETILGQLRPS